jgi:hypothetical protein
MNFLNDRKKVGVMRNLPAFFIIVLLMLPVLFLIFRLDFGFNENWIHFKTYLLGDAASNTALLVIGTVLTTGTIGVLLAYGVTAYDFPFRGAIRWLLYLPLTIPPLYRCHSDHFERMGYNFRARFDEHIKHNGSCFYLYGNAISLCIWDSQIFFGEPFRRFCRDCKAAWI